MQRYIIPPDTLKALLASSKAAPAPACPFAFLFDGQPAPLDPHIKWLIDQGLGTGSSGRRPGLTLQPAVERALHLIAVPENRITVTRVDGDRASRMVYVSDGHNLALAMFTQQDCMISEAEPLHNLAQRLLQDVGPPASQPAPPAPLHTSTETIVVLMSLASQLPASVSTAQAFLREMLRNRGLSGKVLDGLLADQLLQKANGQLMVHPRFAPWYQALTAGSVLEIQRVRLPKGKLPKKPTLVRVGFVGARGQRCLVNPKSDGSGDLLLARPTLDDLGPIIYGALGILPMRGYCLKCGARNRAGARFCKECGQEVRVPEPPKPKAQAPQAQRPAPAKRPPPPATGAGAQQQPPVVYVPVPQAPPMYYMPQAQPAGPGGFAKLFGLLTIGAGILWVVLSILIAVFGFWVMTTESGEGPMIPWAVLVIACPAIWGMFGAVAGASAAFGRGATGKVLCIAFWVPNIAICLLGAVVLGLAFVGPSMGG